MSDETHLVREGKIVDVLKGNFRVQMNDTNETILARLSGKIRTAKINILLDDRVEVKFSIYSPNENGIISRRL